MTCLESGLALPGTVFSSRLPCYVFCICVFTKKTKIVDSQAKSSPAPSSHFHHVQEYLMWKFNISEIHFGSVDSTSLQCEQLSDAKWVEMT